MKHEHEVLRRNRIWPHVGADFMDDPRHLGLLARND